MRTAERNPAPPREDVRRTTAVITQKIGKLANRLILFAHVAAAGREHHFRVINPTFDEYAQYFESFTHALVPGYPLHDSRMPAVLLPRARHLTHGLTRTVAGRLGANGAIESHGSLVTSVHLRDFNEFLDLGSPEFLHLLASSRLVTLRGWGFRDNECLKKHADFLRDLFTPIRSVQEHVAETLRDARQSEGVLIGVHVRRGDYRRFKGGSYFYDVEDYRRMMKHVLTQLRRSDVRFLICSDEEISLDAFSDFAVTRGNDLHVVDLYSLAGCDYIMGPPSSFTLWASFYGNRPLCWLLSSSASPNIRDFRIRYPGEHFDPSGLSMWSGPP